MHRPSLRGNSLDVLQRLDYSTRRLKSTWYIITCLVGGRRGMWEQERICATPMVNPLLRPRLAGRGFPMVAIVFKTLYCCAKDARKES
jgi:hypothetical protein